MPNILITGMSGTGKSAVLGALAARGYEAVDTDSDEWCEWVDIPHSGSATERDWIWRADRMTSLLTLDRPGPVFVAGCKSNQGAFYRYFAKIVLLSARPDVMIRRIERRTSNAYGKRADEQADILGYVETVEPLLRASCDLEIDTSQITIEEVVASIVESIKT
ncbi:MAG: AAA family ATPase [Thermomicrobiales bacterium]